MTTNASQIEWGGDDHVHFVPAPPASTRASKLATDKKPMRAVAEKANACVRAKTEERRRREDMAHYVGVTGVS